MLIEIRPATDADLPFLERKCWRGGEDEMRRRLADQGTCSIIGLDAGFPIAQLYLRRYQPGFRSPQGLHDGSWWADLNGAEDSVRLPDRTVMLGCWHVGYRHDPNGQDQEAPEYRGRGLGFGLLEGAIDWWRSGQTPFLAIGVKATDSEDRDYLGWVGGLPRSAFEALGFRHLLSYEDPYFRAEPAAVPAGIAVPAPSRFHLMLLD